MFIYCILLFLYVIIPNVSHFNKHMLYFKYHDQRVQLDVYMTCMYQVRMRLLCMCVLIDSETYL